MNIKAALILTACCALGVAQASLPPTQAWRRTIFTGQLDVTGPVAVDNEGNVYVTYTLQTPDSGYQLHLAKVDSQSNVVFDHTVGPSHEFVLWTGAFISRPVGGKQYIYAATNWISGYFRIEASVQQFDAFGKPQWGASYDHGGAPNFNSELISAYADSSGIVRLAFKDSHFFQREVHDDMDMVSLDASGNILAQHQINSFLPDAAIFDPALNAWIASMNEPIWVYFDKYAAWGIFDPASGETERYEQFKTHYDSTTLDYTHHFLFPALLPGNAIAVIHNISAGNLSKGPGTLECSLTMLRPDGSLNWRYPQSGMSPGYLISPASFNVSSPIYVIRNYWGYRDALTSIYQFDWTGHLVWKHDQQPCQSLVPVANGFFSIYDRVFGGSFLEHADVNGLYDWGMSYNRDAASLYRVVALPFHKNSFYYVASSSGDFGFNLVIDRFVTDIAFQNIGVESRHNHVGVTLKLNAPAPSGGIVVKLYSNSDKLLMPNGTQQETFRVEPGETDREIRLRAQEVTSNTTVTLLGVSDGIRRTTAITITPQSP